MSQIQSDRWKVAFIVTIACFFTALATGVVISGAPATGTDVVSEPTEDVEAAPAEPVVQAAAPAPAVAPAPQRSVEDCERYRSKTHTDGGRVVKNGLIGGALGAGLGAAGGAIGGSAGKGAGIGALAGAVVSSGYTLHDEHRQKQASREAYQACLMRNGS